MSSSNDWVSPVINFFGGLKQKGDESYRRQYGTDPRFSGGNSSAPAKQKPKSSGNVVRVGGKEYSEEEYMGTGNRSYRDKAQHEQRSLGRGGKGHDLRGGGGRTSSGSRNSMPSGSGSRNEVRTNAAGVTQTGTNTGFKPAGFEEANDLLSRLGIDTVQYGKFESNNLPSKGDPAGNTEKTSTDAKLGGETPDNYTKSGQSPTNQEEVPTEETNIVNQGATLGSRERYRSEFLADRPNMPGEMNESLVGMRAAEASKGLLYASGKYWQEDGKGGFTEIDKATFKNIKRGNQHAQEFAADKVAKYKAEAGIGVTPTLTEAIDDAKEYDYGSDAGYGGTDVDKSEPSEADYPEERTISPIDSKKYADVQKDFKDQFQSFVKQ